MKSFYRLIWRTLSNNFAMTETCRFSFSFPSFVGWILRFLLCFYCFCLDFFVKKNLGSNQRLIRNFYYYNIVATDLLDIYGKNMQGTPYTFTVNLKNFECGIWIIFCAKTMYFLITTWWSYLRIVVSLNTNINMVPSESFASCTYLMIWKQPNALKGWQL